MASDDKTEAPTPKRKREARKEGRIPRSPELTTWGAVLIASYVMPMSLGSAGRSIADLFRVSGEVMARHDEGQVLGLVGAGTRTLVSAVTPLAIAALLLGVAGNLAQTGGQMSASRLAPKMERVSLTKGFKRLFSAESLWQLAKVLLRTGALALAAWIPMRAAVAQMGSSVATPLGAVVGMAGHSALEMVRLVSMLGLLLGVLDYALARRRINKGLRMTKQEVKDEFRQQEGDPHVRGQIRARQREMSRNRMIAAVADASVVLVNPTHVAVALRYEPGGGAPRVVAKGAGEVAARIRAAAEEHRVPLVRDVPLARALHAACDIDDTIPPELFEAVARVLAFVMTAGRKAAAYGGVLVAR